MVRVTDRARAARPGVRAAVRSPNRGVWLRRACAVGAAVAVAYAIYRWQTHDPAAMVAYRAARALEHHDAAALVRLSDPAENADMSLTPGTVSAALASMGWCEPGSRSLRVMAMPVKFTSRREFDLVPSAGTGQGKPWRWPVRVDVVQTGPGKPFVLRLSGMMRLLATTCTPPGGGPNTQYSFRDLTARAGIRGFWSGAADKKVYYATGVWQPIHEAPSRETRPAP